MRFSTAFKTAAILLVLLLTLSNIVIWVPDRTMFTTNTEKDGSGTVPGIDSDGDGLKDTDEDLNRNGRIDSGEVSPSDPFNEDSDGDGWKDGEEFSHYDERRYNLSLTTNWIRLFSTNKDSMLAMTMELSPEGDPDKDGLANILDPDSDNDGIIDGVEIEGGLDPLDPDSDGDTIPDGDDTQNGVVVDSDGDGIDDGWETYYGVDDPDADPDGDLLTNLVEYENGRDPGHMDGYAGHLGSFATSGFLEYDDPEMIHFITKGLGPSYLRVSSFYRFNGRIWSPGPYYSEDPILSDDVSNVNVTFNGSWQGYLPSPFSVERSTGSDPDDRYPHREFEIPQIREDIIYSPVPIQGYDILVRNTTLDIDPMGDRQAMQDAPSSYTEVHSSIRSEVWELAGNWEDPEKSDLENAMLIADLLGSRCFYSTDSNFDSDEENPLYRFLFLTRSGNALDFASAYAIIMRMIDIPSRVVMGYALGEESGDMRIYRQGHLHAWVEISIEGTGWVQVEVTPPSLTSTGGSGITGSGKDPLVIGPRGGDGGGTLVGFGNLVLDPNGDLDGDNLTNGEEEILGTDPRKRDTDGDDLEDKIELTLFFTDPTRVDTDDDGLWDGEEVNLFGTDPNSKDTDKGGMIDGAEINYVPNPLDPLNATDDTALTDVDGDGINETQEKAFNTNPGDPDTDRDGLLDGEELFSYLTDPNDPDTDLDGLTDFDEVNGIYSFPTDPLKRDTDGDGISDLNEILNMTNARSMDSDRDGLSDAAELQAGTDPNDPDSDDDGLLDGYEVELRTDPLDSDTDSDGIIDSLDLWYGFNPRIDQGSIPPADRDNDGIRDEMEPSSGTLVGSNDTDMDGIPDGMEFFMLHTDPVSKDTDGDGLDDLSEIMETLTDPLSNDTDGDGLLDVMESLFGSSPILTDSDLDLSSDGYEYLKGTDPMDPDTDDGGLLDGTESMLGKDPFYPMDDIPFSGDLDGDGLTDPMEIIAGTNMTLPDSDGDGLSDGEEFHVLNTLPLEMDTDEDGLSDGEEVNVFFTDPLEPDTDLDGIKDGSEIDDWGTDPLRNDTDNDLLADGEEIQIGTDPGDPDGDNDGLTDGYEVLVDQDPENDGIQSLDPTNPDTDGGGADDGLEVDHGGDPLDPDDDPLFTDVDGDGLLDVEEDLNGNRQKDANETDLRNPDTDEDGILDSYEVWGSFGIVTDPLDPDTDNDTITDGEEVLIGEDGYITDPTSKDTDNDTLSDSEEIFGIFGDDSDPTLPDGDGDHLNDTLEVIHMGTDPLDQDTDSDGLPDGWVDGWRGLPENGVVDIGEFEDRNLDGMVDPGQWNLGVGPGETDPLDPDSDGGGVTDGQEVFYKGLADPLSSWDDELIKDTDGDGLSDMEENGTGYDTEWDDPDTDSDGLSDGFETIIVNGISLPGELTGHNGFDPTDPLRSDSDSDGLLDGWETENMTDPNDPDTDGDNLWDGYFILGPDDKFHMGEMSENLGYDPTDPLDPDTDGDGLTDGEEIIFYGTDPNLKDTDDDGLSDNHEITTRYNYTKRPDNGFLGLKRTNPLDPDTDSGGMIDGLEAELGLDPLDPDDDDGFQDSDGDGLTNYQERTQVYFPPEAYDNVDWNGDGLEDGYPDWQNPDTDGDGLGDGEEFFNRKFALNPVSNDTDRDGLNDRMEIEDLNTDPTKFDSDDDGLSDPQEIILTYNRSYVDWDLDGVIDHRTDPMNPDTDLDSINDGKEVLGEDPTNPLDPGDPGIELLPKEIPFVFIDSAPFNIQKLENLLDGSFRVRGIVRDQRGDPIEGMGVSILVVSSGIGRDDAIELEMNQELRVGSIERTGSDGIFSIVCTPNPGTPYGDVVVYAVSRSANLDGKRFLPSISEGSPAHLKAGSIIQLDLVTMDRVRGDVILVKGRLTDSGGVPVSGVEINLISWNGDLRKITTDEGGFISVRLSLPDSIGSFNYTLEFNGNADIGPSKGILIVNTHEGPSIDLEPIEDRYLSGDILFVNGTISGGSFNPVGIVNISMISDSGQKNTVTVQGSITDSGFSVPVTLDPERFQPGPYSISVSYLLPDGSLSTNASIGFELLGMTTINVYDKEIVRGDDPFISIFLSHNDNEPYKDGLMRITLPELPFLTPAERKTNSTGWAVFEFNIDESTPLGITPMIVEHVSDEGNNMPGVWEGYINIKAPALIDIAEDLVDLTLLDGIMIEGRLHDDLGTGIDGENDLELILNGNIIGTASTSGGGWFRINEILPQYSRIGEGFLIVRFSGLTDERSEWYTGIQEGMEVNVNSRTYLSVDDMFDQDNSTITVSITDERKNPISDAPLRVGVGVNFMTYLTGRDGNLTVDLGELSGGEIVTISYPGEPGRFFLPSNMTLEVPEEDRVDEGWNRSLILVVVAVIIAAVLIPVLISKTARLRKDIGTRKAKQKRIETRYPFDPRSTSQRMLVETYRDAMDDLRAMGLARPLSMTPDEYRDTMMKADNGIKGLGKLTDLFDEARYSDHNISSHLISRAKQSRSSLDISMRAKDRDEITRRFTSARAEIEVPVHRPVEWRLKMDHASDLKDLLGDKEVEG